MSHYLVYHSDEKNMVYADSDLFDERQQAVDYAMQQAENLPSGHWITVYRCTIEMALKVEPPSKH